MGVMPLALRASVCTMATFGLCGCDEQTVTTQHAIFTTVTECVSLLGLDADFCQNALDPAKVAHPPTGPSYSFAAVCEQIEGAGNCQQSPDHLWRPKAVAYVATLGAAPKISPLYPRLDGQKDFRRADGALQSIDGEILVTASAKKRLVVDAK